MYYRSVQQMTKMLQSKSAVYGIVQYSTIQLWQYVKDKIRHYKLWPNMLGNFHNKSIMKLKAYAKSTWKYTFRQKWYNFMARQQQQRQQYPLLWMRQLAVKRRHN